MSKTKLITAAEAAGMVRDKMTVMIGGFMANGTPEAIIDALAASGVKELTVICNDAGLPGKGTEKLLQNKQIKKLIASHVGLTPECGRQYSAGELELELVPQGTLAERIRCKGAGLGGFLTPTGIGTVVAEGKKTISVNGQDYLLELPLRADIALIKGYTADKRGNIRYKGSTRNFNPIMAAAADIVIAEADEILEDGFIGPEYVETPGLFIDYIVGGIE